ncbi:MAG: SMC-Scp complex subunit ScpB [Bacteroidia bacterium]
MRQLDQNVEALIFASEAAVTADELIACLKAAYGWELTREDITDAVLRIKMKYVEEDFSFELNEIAGGYEFLSKKDYHAAIHVMLQLKEKKRLSTAALETLAIIAYKQPITKPELEQIRGVSCDYSIQKLLEKDLIVISGKSDGPGKPILYSTSKNFMDHFGLRSVKDLPKLKDIQPGAMSEIGIPLEMMDDVPVDVAPEDMEGNRDVETTHVDEAPGITFDAGVDAPQETDSETTDENREE